MQRQATEFYCARCENSHFPTKNHLVGHLRFTHEIYEGNNLEPISYDCDECGKDFDRISFFNEHRLLHQPPKLSCTECAKKFRQLKGLRQHLLKQHNKVEKRELHSCPNCGKTFKSAFHLTVHTNFHKPPQFSCIDCGKKFFLWRNLQCHIGHAHRGKKYDREILKRSAPFPCLVCQKRFVSAKHLNVHSYVHNVNKFKCSMCEAEFTQHHVLDRHLFSVHCIKVSKEQKCDVCGKKFPTRQGLYNHKQYHSEPTVPCSLCDKMCHTQGALRLHIKFIHSSKWQMPTELSTKVKSYTCAVCCRPFGHRKDHLTNHLRRKDNVTRK